MGIGELFLLAVGLSMDAFAVSVCKGLAMKKATLKAEATCGLWFGGFQMLMPVTGFLFVMRYVSRETIIVLQTLRGFSKET